jgi:hypothetical protein
LFCVLSNCSQFMIYCFSCMAWRRGCFIDQMAVTLTLKAASNWTLRMSKVKEFPLLFFVGGAARGR